MSSSAGQAVDGSDSQRLLTAVAGALDVEPSELDLDTDLQATGRLDSLAIASVVAFIEDELHLKVAIDQIVPENFTSVRQIVELVGRLRR